jgi:hypothetical protein
VSAIVFLPAGFFMTGTSAKLPVGTAFKAFLDEDVTLELAASAPPPLVIGASAQAVPAGTANVSAAIAVATPAPLGPTPVTAAVVGPPRAAANTPSGFCYDVPKGYVGTGSAEKPALTSATPACGSLGRK